MQKTLGMKFDSEKRRMGLLPPRALESVADVLTFGAKKYLPNNWKYVENGHERYLDAALRHMSAYMKGEYADPETGMPHLSHALCCLMFIVDLDIEEDESYQHEMGAEYDDEFTRDCEECNAAVEQAAEDNSREWPFAGKMEWSNLDSILHDVITKSRMEKERAARPQSLGDILNQMIRNGENL
jgi:hypothetical protein